MANVSAFTTVNRFNVTSPFFGNPDESRNPQVGIGSRASAAAQIFLPRWRFPARKKLEPRDLIT